MVKSNQLVWEDQEVLFDLPFAYLKLRSGEKIFDRIEPIEDTKGNSGTKGRMVVTNLRIIWHSLSSPRINLSIGLNCIQSASTKMVNSGIRGATQALSILAVYKGSSYEFVFTNLSRTCVRHYTSAVGVYKAYGSSRMYRELKLREAIIYNKTLRLLPQEQITLQEHSIWNLSTDSGNLGTMIITNVRVVWYADFNELFNVSMPYITIEKVSIRDSIFGQALVLTAWHNSGGYVLGFRADPRERLKPLYTELKALHQAYNERPIFGIEINWSNEVSKHKTDNLDQLEEFGEPPGEMGSALYLASQMALGDDAVIRPTYSPYLGLAIEPLKEGFTLKSLFEVQTKAEINNTPR